LNELVVATAHFHHDLYRIAIRVNTHLPQAIVLRDFHGKDFLVTRVIRAAPPFAHASSPSFFAAHQIRPPTALTTMETGRAARPAVSPISPTEEPAPAALARQRKIKE
jgi:hypothetical protein